MLFAPGSITRWVAKFFRHPEPVTLELRRYLVRRCVVRTCVLERGRGEGKRRIWRKNGGPTTRLTYVPTAYFLLPLAKLLPLTNGPKKDEGWKDEGYYEFSSYFLLLLRLTDFCANISKAFLNGVSVIITGLWDISWWKQNCHGIFRDTIPLKAGLLCRKDVMEEVGWGYWRLFLYAVTWRLSVVRCQNHFYPLPTNHVLSYTSF
jgi:hypothetical protein